MSIENARVHLDRIIEEALAAKAELEGPTGRVVRAGESLQAALDAGGNIEVEASAIFEGLYEVKSNTSLRFQAGSGVHATTASALLVRPGTHHVTIVGPTLSSSAPAHAIVQVGLNTSEQTRLEDAPHDIRLEGASVAGFDGKRAIALHSYATEIVNCEVLDVWDRAGRDSQAIYIGNAPGDILIEGGRYSAGSEIILSGGEVTRIPNLVPSGITIQNAALFRPLSWQTDGVARKVKNIVEIKNGVQVTIHNNNMAGCWRDGQDGWAIVLTPALDGASGADPRPGGIVSDIDIRDNDIRDCSSVLQILGRDYASITAQPLTNLNVSRNTCVVSRARYGGFGQLARIGAEPGTLNFADNVFVGDGSSLIYYYRGSVMGEGGAMRPGGNLGTLHVTDSTLQLGAYGINLDGRANAADWQLACNDLRVERNSFGGPQHENDTWYSPMRPRFPDNSYLSIEAFMALPEIVDALRG